MSQVGRAAARAAVRLYPRAWRDRYGAELSDLVELADSSVADAADVALSALREHVNGGTPMRVEAAHRHPGGFALAAGLVLLPTFAVVALSLIGHELGLAAVAAAVDPGREWVNTAPIVSLALVAAPLAALVLAALPLLDLRIGDDTGVPVIAIGVRAIGANLLVGSLAIVIGALLAWHAVIESVVVGA